MQSEALQRLIDQARNDPAFLHSLVFKPESVLQDIDYLDRQSRADLIALTPEEAIARLTGKGSGTRREGASSDYAP